MTNTKLDRRKKYTRMVLKDSLIKLLKEKHISAITVKEICELADINRSTFYAHFLDQYDLLEKIEEEIIEDMGGYLNQYNYEKEEDDLQLLERIIEYFVANHDVCQTLLNEKMDTSFEKKVMVFAHQSFMQKWKTINRFENDASKYVSTFTISGSIHVIKAWANNGMDKTPKEMAEIINNLIKNGLSGV